MSAITRPALPRTTPLPGGRRSVSVPRAEPRERQRATDEFGLSTTVFKEYGPIQRRYVALCYEDMGLNKMLPPTHQRFGTIPEAIFYGGLLARDYRRGRFGHGFGFQSDLLGGRVPGGSVADFMVYVGPRRIAVFVQSFFHALNSPFGGAAKVETDTTLFRRVHAFGGINAVVLVNLPNAGFPLERGTTAQVDAEYRRVLTA